MRAGSLVTRPDLLIRGGTVVDPASGVHAVRDVAIRDGRIVADTSEAASTIDARGKLVLPGLIDLHTHLFHGYHGARPDEACLARGTTTALDGGSAGANAFAGFEEYVIRTSRTRVRAWLNISTLGLIEIRVGELMNLLAVDVEAAVRTAKRYPELIVGFKVRLSEYVAGADFKPALRLAREAADATGLPLMVHIGDTDEPLPAALAFLKKGDVVTHSYTGRRHGILDADGRVLDAVREARQGGIWFDAAHGRRHFGFAAIRKALEQGFLVDSLSSDTSMRSTRDPGYHLPLLMTKLMALGLSLDEVVPLVTSNPARYLGSSAELGTLAAGAAGDVAILEEVEGTFTLVDAEERTVDTKRRLRPWKTVLGGAIIDASPEA